MDSASIVCDWFDLCFLVFDCCFIFTTHIFIFLYCFVFWMYFFCFLFNWICLDLLFIFIVFYFFFITDIVVSFFDYVSSNILILCSFSSSNTFRFSISFCSVVISVCTPVLAVLLTSPSLCCSFLKYFGAFTYLIVYKILAWMFSPSFS